MWKETWGYAGQGSGGESGQKAVALFSAMWRPSEGCEQRAEMRGLPQKGITLVPMATIGHVMDAKEAWTNWEQSS